MGGKDKISSGFQLSIIFSTPLPARRRTAKFTSAKKSASLSAEIFKPETALKSSRSLRASFTPPFWKN